MHFGEGGVKVTFKGWKRVIYVSKCIAVKEGWYNYVEM